MLNLQSDPLRQVETTCGSLLYELQIIWDEVGESDDERDKMLLQLEQECLEVYKRKVDQANRSRAQLRQAIADSEAELAAICSAIGERPVHIRQSDQNPGNLKAELRAILPQVEEMRKRKIDRRNQFVEVLEQIQKIKNEIYSSNESSAFNIVVDESDSSLRKLEELHRELHALQNEKSDRLKQILDSLNILNSLCLVLGMEFKQTVNEIHPSLGEVEGAKNMNNNTIEKLAAAIQKLLEVKIQRMQQLQDLATTMLELWNLMDTPIEEQQGFQTVTCKVAASEHEITEPNILSVDFISCVEAEVSRLEEFKANKMKELVLKKRSEMQEICRKTHIIPELDDTLEIVVETIESGSVDPACILEQIELQISKAKQEAFSRKEILEKVDKWMAACEEECWLEHYSRDENRYSAGRGAHLTLKRAEKARALVNKLPTMVDALASKTTTWENERGVEFTYDGVCLISMLEEYTILRQEKEQERKRQRDQKKLQGQLIAEQETLFGSKPSPMKSQSGKKNPGLSCGGASNKGAMFQTKTYERQLSQPRNDGFAVSSTGRRGLDNGGLPVKKHSFNAGNTLEVELPMIRRPFSPIPSMDSSKSNTENILDQNSKHSDILQKTPPSTTNTPFMTPSKTIPITEEENRAPKAMTIPIPPSTPSTLSVPMQTAITPAPPVSYGTNEDEDAPKEEIEYSFEERRASFVLPKAHPNSVGSLIKYQHLGS